MIGPNVRRALHQCVDILCDAVAEDAEEKPAKRPRARALPPLDMPANVTQEELESVRKRLERAGFKRAG